MIQTTSVQEWRLARQNLLKEEKQATKLLDQLASKRRALPAVEVADPDQFKFQASSSSSSSSSIDSDHRTKTLLDLFAGKSQLVIYFSMFHEKPDGKLNLCPGCGFFLDNVSGLEHLGSRDTNFVAIGPASVDKLEEFKERMGWEFEVLGSKHTFDGVGESISWRIQDGAQGLVFFLREGGRVYHTYTTEQRGVDILLGVYQMLDMTRLGRGDEEKGFKLHDEY